MFISGLFSLPGWEDINGLGITEIARKRTCSPFSALVRLAEANMGATLMLFHSYSGNETDESVLEKVLSHDLCLFETDIAIKNLLPQSGRTLKMTKNKIIL